MIMPLSALTLIGLMLSAPSIPMPRGAAFAEMQDVSGNNAGPLWSPFGDRILFTKRHLARTDIARTEVYVMNGDGGQPRRLTTTGRRQ